MVVSISASRVVNTFVIELHLGGSRRKGEGTWTGGTETTFVMWHITCAWMPDWWICSRTRTTTTLSITKCSHWSGILIFALTYSKTWKPEQRSPRACGRKGVAGWVLGPGLWVLGSGGPRLDINASFAECRRGGTVARGAGLGMHPLSLQQSKCTERNLYHLACLYKPVPFCSFYKLTN